MGPPSDKETAEAIDRLKDRIVDDHHELKAGQQSILSAVRTGFRDATAQRDAMMSAGTDKSSNFNIYWMLGTVAVAIIAAYARLRGA